MKRILVVTSHPDDESFLPGGTIAKYAAEGVEIHLLCATKGESGEKQTAGRDSGTKDQQMANLDRLRQREHAKAAKVLGIKSVEYLGYIDGTLNNNMLLYDEIPNKIIAKAKEFKPDVLLTLDLLGVSGHLDHIAMALASRRAFEKLKEVKKIYHYAISVTQERETMERFGRKMWGRKESEITTKIDVSKFLERKIAAAESHQSQLQDVQRSKMIWKKFGKTERFILGASRVKTKFLEKDLFAGIS